MMKKLIIIIIVAFIAVGAYLYVDTARVNDVEVDGGEILLETEKRYTNDQYGFSFIYPTSYFLEERRETEEGNTHLALVLTEDTEENRLVREGKTPAREGPVAIVIDVYDLSKSSAPSLMEWLKDTPASNFHLSDGTFANVTLSGTPAVSYEWDGLYRGRTIAIAREGVILSLTETFTGASDPIRSIFETVHKSFTLK